MESTFPAIAPGMVSATSRRILAEHMLEMSSYIDVSLRRSACSSRSQERGL